MTKFRVILLYGTLLISAVYYTGTAHSDPLTDCISDIEELSKRGCNELIELGPPSSTLGYNFRGVRYFNEGKFALAISDFSKAISQDPENMKAYENRAVAYAKIGKNELSEEDRRTWNTLDLTKQAKNLKAENQKRINVIRMRQIRNKDPVAYLEHGKNITQRRIRNLVRMMESRGVSTEIRATDEDNNCIRMKIGDVEIGRYQQDESVDAVYAASTYLAGEKLYSDERGSCGWTQEGAGSE